MPDLNSTANTNPPADEHVCIYILPKCSNGGQDGYRWAWKESYDAKVFGWASTIDEVKDKAARMFPGRPLRFVCL